MKEEFKNLQNVYEQLKIGKDIIEQQIKEQKDRWFQIEIDNVTTKHKKLEETIRENEEVKNQLTQKINEISLLKSDIEQLRNQLTEQETNDFKSCGICSIITEANQIFTSQLEKENCDLKNQITNQCSQIESFVRENENLHDQLNKQNAQLEILSGSLNLQVNCFLSRKHEIDSLHIENRDLNAKLEKTQQKYNNLKKTSERMMSKIRRELVVKEKLIAEKEESITNLNSMINQGLNDFEQSQWKLKMVEIKAKKLEKLIKDKDKIIKDTDNAIAQMSREKSTYIRDFKETEQKLKNRICTSSVDHKFKMDLKLKLQSGYLFNELSSLKTLYSNTKSECQSFCNEGVNYLNDVQFKLKELFNKFLLQQNNMFQNRLNFWITQCNTLDKKFQETKNEHEIQMQLLKRQLEEKVVQIKQYDDERLELKLDNQTIIYQLNEMSYKSQHLEKKIATLAEENVKKIEHMELNFVQKQIEVEELTKQISELETVNANISVM